MTLMPNVKGKSCCTISGEVAAKARDFVVETGNNEASVGICSTTISLAVSPYDCQPRVAPMPDCNRRVSPNVGHAATVIVAVITASSTSLGSRSPVAAQAKMFFQFLRDWNVSACSAAITAVSHRGALPEGEIFG